MPWKGSQRLSALLLPVNHTQCLFNPSCLALVAGRGGGHHWHTEIKAQEEKGGGGERHKGGNLLRLNTERGVIVLLIDDC